MASDSILTSIPFWSVIGFIFVLAVLYAVCIGTRVNPFRVCGDCCRGCGNAATGCWACLTCCCRGQEAPPKKEADKASNTKKVDDTELEIVLEQLHKLKDNLPLLPLKREECRWDKKDYLVERGERAPTVV